MNHAERGLRRSATWRPACPCRRGTVIERPDKVGALLGADGGLGATLLMARSDAMNLRSEGRPAAMAWQADMARPPQCVTAGPDPLHVVLPRLERVRRHADGWRAECPTGHKSHGTLSVAQGSDGRLLLHCFAGCEAVDVLGMVGLTLADLYPERIRDTSPEGRRHAREAFKHIAWVAALGVLARESTVVVISAHDLAEGRALLAVDHDRLLLADQRIQDARGVLT